MAAQIVTNLVGQDQKRNMESNIRTARIAGLIYLVVVVTGIYSLGYVPGKLMVPDDAASTFNNIVASEMLFRSGILAGVTCYIFFLILPLVLYKLLRPVDPSLAILMVLLAVISVPVSLVNMLNKFAVLQLISKADYMKVFAADTIHAQVMMQLKAFGNGNQIASVFWGLWLFPFGYLVFKSGFLPKILGVFLMAGCVGYLIHFTARLMYPAYEEMEVSKYMTLPASIGEIGICLWLLIVGVKGGNGEISHS